MANPGLVKSFVAEAAVLPYRIVKFGSADGQVLQAAAATDASVGVADNLGQDTANSRVDVILSDIADVEAGGAITRGALVTSDASGRAVSAAPAAGANVRVIGTALANAGAAGEIIPLLLSPGSFQG